MDDLLINPNPQHNRPKSDVDFPLALPSGRLSPSSRSLPLPARNSATYKEGRGRGAGTGKRVGLDGGGGVGGGVGGGGGGGCKGDDTFEPDDEAGKAVFGLGLTRGVAKSSCRKDSYRATAKALGASPAAASSTDAANRRSRAPQQGQQGQRGQQRGHQGKKRLATMTSTPTASTPPMAAALVTEVSLRNHKRARTGGHKSTSASPPDAAHPAKATAAKANSGLVKFDRVEVLVGLDQDTTRELASVTPSMQRQVTALSPPLCSEDMARLAMNSVGVAGESAEAGGVRTPIAIASSGTSRGRDSIGCAGAGASQSASESVKSVAIDWAVGHAESDWPGVERASWTPLMTAQNTEAGPLKESSGKLHMGGGGGGGSGTGPVGSKANSCTSETTADLSGAEEESLLPVFAPDQPARVNSGGGAVRDAGRDAVGDAGHETVDVAGEQAGAVGLDDFGLESSLLLDITAACNSGSGSTSSSWLPLSVGSYLNTEEAFTAFAISPCEFVPGCW